MLVKKIFSKYIKSTENDKSFDSTKRYKDYDIVIHIGAPKTGSSAIQNFLLKNKKTLLKKGLFYPIHPLDENSISAGHSSLYTALIERRKEDAEKIFIGWYQHARNLDKTLLISSEAFFNIPKLMKDFLSDKKVLILSYYRSPLEYIVSVHNQLIKRHHETRTLRAYIELSLEPTKRNQDLISRSWIDIFQQWESFFGKENLIVRSYQREAYFEGRIEKDFIQQIGLEFSDLKLDHVPINKSYTEAALELKRLINYVIPRDHQLNHRIDLKLQSFSDNLLSSSLNLKQAIGNELYDKLIIYTNEIEETIVNKYVENFIPNKKSTKISGENLQKTIMPLQEVFEYLCSDSEIESYLMESTLIKLESGALSFSLFNLAQLLEIENLDKYEIKDHWFSNQQIRYIAEKEYKEADFLRDIARLLLERKDYLNAQKLIRKALKLRPNGKVIIELDTEITQKLI